MYYPEADGTINSILASKERAMIRARTVEINDQPPWTQPGVNLQDYFNFGLDDAKWRLYINKQILMRFERNLIQKHLSQKEQHEKTMSGNDYQMPPYMHQPMFYPPPPHTYGGH